MKNTLYLFILFLGVAMMSCEQGNGNELSQKKDTYKQALRNGDYSVAAQAVYDIMAIQPKSTHWRDSLALIYVQQKAFRQAIKVSEQQLADNPSDTLMVKVQALSYKALNEPKKALETYERLYPLTQDIYHLYEVASLQYNMTRLKECLQTADMLLKHPDLKKAKISLAFNRQNQIVPLEAAIFNLKGVIAKDMDKEKEAGDLFKKALAIHPEFELAKGNMEAM